MSKTVIRKLAELKDIEVKLISLVDAGANRKTLIYKSASEETPNWDKTILIVKKDEEKRLVYCVVYSPNEEDTHGHFATEETIEKACHSFFKRSNTHAIDEQHNMEVAENVYIVESWIVKENDALFPEDVGAWAICIKVDNDEVWKKVIEGEYKGVSLYGFATIIEKAKTETKFSKIKEVVLKFVNELADTEYIEDMKTELTEVQKKAVQVRKDFASAYERLTLSKVVDAMYSAMCEILYNWQIDDEEKAMQLLTSIDQMRATVLEIQGADASEDLTENAIAKSTSFDKAKASKLEDLFKQLNTLIESAESVSVQKEKLIQKFKPQGDTEMTAEEIKKQIDDAVKPVVEKNTKLEEELKKANDEIALLKNTSKGSKQVEEVVVTKGDGEKKTEVFKWTA